MSKTAFVPTAAFRVPKAQLDRLRRAIEAGAEVVIEQPDGKRVSSRELSRFLAAAVSEVASGDEVVLLRSESEVSPAEAAELLGISRQFVDRLIDVGKLPARRLPGSRHRRLRVADIIAFTKGQDQRQGLISDAVNALIDGGAEY
ncbi:MAG TPA: helix-turn-helix domain-containing protein [Acidimicrobiales bacterium]|nr:helix-turn-helix domain-containing protein [Acidimicrobiales bacterium]